MNDFTASNGVEIALTNAGRTLFLESPGGSWPTPEEHSILLNTDFVPALREFFRADDDERLGRWRWPENPDYVVYPPNEEEAADGRGLLILFEPGGGSAAHYTREWLAGVVDIDGWAVAKCAQAYFDAHPERKPWHDAKPGETWRLTVNDRSPLEIDLTFNVIGVEGVIPSRFARPQVGGEQMEYPLDSPAITAGRRIYPEGGEQ